MCKRSGRQKAATSVHAHLLEGGVQQGGMCKGGAAERHLLARGVQLTVAGLLLAPSSRGCAEGAYAGGVHVGGIYRAGPVQCACRGHLLAPSRSERAPHVQHACGVQVGAASMHVLASNVQYKHVVCTGGACTSKYVS